MVAAWRTGSQADFTKELSEPVEQRILRVRDGCKDLSKCDAFLGFWPSEGNTTTNILCAIMQAWSSSPERFQRLRSGGRLQQLEWNL